MPSPRAEEKPGQASPSASHGGGRWGHTALIQSGVWPCRTNSEARPEKAGA